MERDATFFLFENGEGCHIGMLRKQVLTPVTNNGGLVNKILDINYKIAFSCRVEFKYLKVIHVDLLP